MIVADNETSVDLLYYGAIARTVVRLVAEDGDEHAEADHRARPARTARSPPRPHRPRPAHALRRTPTGAPSNLMNR